MAWEATCRPLAKHVDPVAHAFFWKLMIVLLALLCCASLLDLQGFMHLAGKELAISEGWYRRRRVFQIIILLWLVASSLGVAAYLTWLQRKMSWGYHLALIGVFYLLGLQAVRAISLHHVDKVLALQWHGMLINDLMEYAGIIAMMFAAYFSGRKRFWKKRVHKKKQDNPEKISRKKLKIEETDALEEARQRLARRVAYREKQAGFISGPEDSSRKDKS